jgi:signal transduction histidine kinase
MPAQLDTVFEMVTHLQRLAEREKAALARELHDELGGLLISAVMDLSTLSPRVAALGDDAKDKMRRLREALHSAIEITRRITEELRPTLLDNVGLFAALRWQLKQVCARSKVNCTDDLPASELRLTPGASIALFRSAQEALLVGLEPHGVSAIALAGKVDGSALLIQIKGDGANLIDEPRPLWHITLESIRHRVRALGGEVNVDHPPNGGIVVVVSTPIANVVRPH